jgi:oligosaccharide repeat unit polymerase
MQVIIIISVSFVVLLVSYWLFSKAAGSLSPLKLNTISYVFYVQIVMMTFVGSILVACNLLDFHYLVKPVKDVTKIYAWLGVLYSMIAMPIGMILLNKIFRLNAVKAFHAYIKKPVFIRQGPVLSMAIVSVFTIISLLVLLYTIHYSESVPFLTLLRGNMRLAAIERTEIRSAFGGIEYIRNLLGYLMMPVIAYYVFILAYVKRNLLYWILFLLNFCMAAMLLVFDIQKAPVVFFVIGILILYTLLEGGFSRKKFLTFFVTAICLIGVGYVLTTSKNFWDQISNYDSALWGRIFITEYGGYLLSLELFPDKITQPTWYIGLPSFILDFFHLKNEESARLLMKYINPVGVARGEANLISSYYLGEAWANYGWIGIILAPFIVGFVVQSVHIFLLKHPKEPLIMAFYAYITVRWLLSSGFVTFLYLKIILYPLIFYFLFKFLMQLMANKKQVPDAITDKV